MSYRDEALMAQNKIDLSNKELDELEKIDRIHIPFQGKLNLQQVGVFGQSLGGYTALALAGAKINFQQLKKDCTPNVLGETWNMSLLLQCRALELPNNFLTEQQVKLTPL